MCVAVSTLSCDAVSEPSDGQDFQQVSDGDVEAVDGQVEALVEQQLRAPRNGRFMPNSTRSTRGQTAAYAEQQLAMQATSAAPQQLRTWSRCAATQFRLREMDWLVPVRDRRGLALQRFHDVRTAARKLAAQTSSASCKPANATKPKQRCAPTSDRERETLNEQLNGGASRGSGRNDHCRSRRA